ncbi:MAG: SMP-30/gluconolactonase/LRE family protein [Lautropia sp.]
MQELASGLRFPEGPVALPDGSVLAVEIHGRTLTRISASGEKRVVAALAGGPNGAAIGPDGRCYVCNNGGLNFHVKDGVTFPGLPPDDYAGGWIESVDLETGESRVLYRSAGDIQLRGPNDLVFDRHGGFWFTDTGKVMSRQRDRGAVFYATIDGKHIRQAIFPVDGANGIGLSPDDGTLYVAEGPSGRVWAYEIAAPGEIRRFRGPVPWERGRLLAGLGGNTRFDSLAVDGDGNVCVATMPHGGISVIAPDGRLVDQIPMPDPFTTNICFGGPDLRTAYITLSSTGKLIAMPWPRAGLPLYWLNRRPAPA